MIEFEVGPNLFWLVVYLVQIWLFSVIFRTAVEFIHNLVKRPEESRIEQRLTYTSEEEEEDEEESGIV